MKNVVFVSPFMGRTGSEQSALNIINHCSSINPIIFSGENGLLLKEVKSNIPVYVNPLNNTNNLRLNKILNKIGIRTLLENEILKIIRKHGPFIWLLNTIINVDILHILNKNNIPFALWIHEYNMLYESISKTDFNSYINKAQFIICCSEYIYNDFKLLGLKNIYLFKESINTSEIKHCEEKSKEIRNSLSQYSKVFLMSGQLSYRKGFHLVPEIASWLNQNNSALVWLGKSNNYALEFFIKKKIESLKIDNIIFPGEQTTDYYNWINACDAFILTSIEDPYPLVMLEAAYLKKPVFGFNSGGVTEFISEGMGKIIPLINIEMLFSVLSDFINDRIPIDYENLNFQAGKHCISNRIVDFENIILKHI